MERQSGWRLVSTSINFNLTQPYIEIKLYFFEQVEGEKEYSEIMS